jgi:hypothetical protein
VVLKDPDGRDIVPTNGAGNTAIISYLNKFDRKTQLKAFGFNKSTDRHDTKRGYYPVYSSSHKGMMSSKESFTKNLGKAGRNMSASEINEAYSVYQALTSDKDYQVEVIHPGSVDSRGVQMQGSDFVEFVPGYSPRYSETNKVLGNDLKEGNFDNVFNSNRRNSNGNIFGDGFNFYKNFVNDPYSPNDKKTAGVILIDGREDFDLGKVFKSVLE